MDWLDKKNCEGIPVSLFYPGQGQSIHQRVVDACADCPVKFECLDHALRYEGFGYWGGTTEKERQRLRKARGIRLNSPSTGLGNIGNKTRREGRPRGKRPPCGTMQGYNYEQRHRIPICDSCKFVRSEYNRKRTQEKKQKI